jgi:hypothetical protein
MSRNILQTKTFWINLAVTVGIYAWNQFEPSHQVDMNSALIAWVLTATGVRTITSGPVHIMPRP